MRAPTIIAIPMLLACLYAWAIFATSFGHPGAIGPNYNTPGTDYMVFHGGIRTALRGDWPLLFDADRFTDFLNAQYRARLSQPLTYRPFIYPPSFLILLLPFSIPGFLGSYLLFQAATACGLVVALCAGATRRLPALALAAAALASPAASVNVLWGQGAFLTAALLIGGTRLLPRHQILGGLVLGFLSVKPQHALLVPVMLLALRAWPAMLAALLSAAALAGGSWALFGAEPWRLWAASARHMAGNVPQWDNSVHTCAMLLGTGPMLANVLMAAAWIGGAWAVYAAFRGRRAGMASLAVLLAASNLAAPHTGPYDTLLLVLAVGFVLVDAQAASALMVWILGLIVWLLPLYGQPLVSPVARLAPLLTIVLIGVLVRRAEGGNQVSSPPLKKAALPSP